MSSNAKPPHRERPQTNPGRLEREPRRLAQDHRRYFDGSAASMAMAALDSRGPSLIHVIVDLDGDLDRAKLRAAWQALFVNHPIIACRTTTLARVYRFIPLVDGMPGEMIEGRETEPVSHSEPGPFESALISRPIDPTRGPLARLAIIDCGTRRRLVVSIHHCAMDARAAVDITDDLRRLYVRARPTERLRDVEPDLTPRTVGAVLAQAPVERRARRELLMRHIRNELAAPRSTHQDPCAEGMPTASKSYTAWTLEPEVVERLRPLRRRRGWTLNDVILGVVSISWTRAFGHPGRRAGVVHTRYGKEPPTTWLMAYDLRPRLRISGGAGNLSGIDTISLSGVGGLDAFSACQAAHEVMRRHKIPLAGLGANLAGERLRRILPAPLFISAAKRATTWLVERRRHNRVLTNIGALPETLGYWGEARATRAFALAPIADSPVTIFTCSGFRDTLTLCVGADRSWLSEAAHTSLGESIEQTLAELC